MQGWLRYFLWRLVATDVLCSRAQPDTKLQCQTCCPCLEHSPGPWLPSRSSTGQLVRSQPRARALLRAAASSVERASPSLSSPPLPPPIRMSNLNFCFHSIGIVSKDPLQHERIVFGTSDLAWISLPTVWCVNPSRTQLEEGVAYFFVS